MQERERDKLAGDIPAPTEGDYSFTDWDNPEDEVEDAPEGYYDAQTGGRPAEEPEEEYELTPDDPDYDLSEAAGYAGREDRGERFQIPQWVLVLLSLLLMLSLLLPVLLRFS